MDAEQLSQLLADSLLPVTVSFGILAGFGLIANLYVFYVYKYKYSKCNFRTFVLCLALIDTASCLFVFPSEMYGHRIWFSYPPSASWFCKVKTLLSGAAVFTSSFVLLLISVDRFRKVCQPFKKQMKVKTAFRLCLSIFGIGSVMIIPCPILFGIQTQNITYKDESFEITSCMRDDAYHDSVWITAYLVSFYYTPVVAFMIITMILYAKLIRKIFFGSFFKFEESVFYKQAKNGDVDRTSMSETDAVLSETEFNHDSDEDKTEEDITSKGDIELKTIDRHGTRDQDDADRKNDRQMISNGSNTLRDDMISNGSNTLKDDNQVDNKNTEQHETSKDETISHLATEREESDKTETRNENLSHTAAANQMSDLQCSTSSVPLTDTSTTMKQTDNPKSVTDHNGIFHNRDEAVSSGTVNVSACRNEGFIQNESKAVSNGGTISPIAHENVAKLKPQQENRCNSLVTGTIGRKSKFNTIQRKGIFCDETLKKLKSKRAFKKRNIKTRSMIMFAVTLIFTMTTTIYFGIFTVIYRKDHIFEIVSTDMAGLFFLCWRIYFINHVINPIVYGFLDPRFRKHIRRSSRKLYNRISKFSLNSLRESIFF